MSVKATDLKTIVIYLDEINEGVWIGETPDVPEIFVREGTPEYALQAVLHRFEKMLEASDPE